MALRQERRVDDADLQTMMCFAERLADAARAETLPRWRTGCAAADKNEGGAWDPVTEADREAERAMRRLIEADFPDHGIQGEEFPEKQGKGRWSWSLDPVDGTRAFVCGLPSWTTLIALLDEGRPVLGVIDAPALDELHVGAGSGLLRAAGTETPLATSGCTRLAEARLSTTDPYLFDGAEAEAWERVRSRVRVTRYGLDGYGYARLAAGSLDLVVEAGLKPHDYNALIPLVRAAGGAIGDWQGGEDFSAGRVIAAATPELYRAAVETML
jgi:myo-inositol-1(or 4)-monophosphatase